MISAPERLAGAQRALIANSQALAQKGMEGAGQLLELNMRTAIAWLGAAPLAMPASLPVLESAGGLPHAGASPQSDAAALATYGMHALEIAAKTNAEIGRLLQQQAMEASLLLNELTSVATGRTPDAGAALLRMMKVPFASMPPTLGTAADPATEQATEEVVRAADAAVQTGRRALRSAD